MDLQCRGHASNLGVSGVGIGSLLGSILAKLLKFRRKIIESKFGQAKSAAGGNEGNSNPIGFDLLNTCPMIDLPIRSGELRNGFGIGNLGELEVSPGDFRALARS